MTSQATATARDLNLANAVRSGLRCRTPDGLLVALDALEATGALAFLSASQKRSVDRARTELAGQPEPQTANRARSAIRTAIARAALAKVERSHGVKFKVRKGTGSMRGITIVKLTDNETLTLFEDAAAALGDAGFSPWCSAWDEDVRRARRWGGHHLAIDWTVVI